MIFYYEYFPARIELYPSNKMTNNNYTELEALIYAYAYAQAI